MAIAERKSVSVEQVLKDWKEHGIRNVRFELPDMHGTSRSKIVPIEHAAGYSKDGLNMYGGAAVLDSRSDVVPGTLYNEEVAYADQLLHPDLATAAVVPWVEATGRFICDATWADGRPLAASPRHVFARVLERSRQLGYEPVMGMESEFYLLDAETHKQLFSGYQIFNSVRNTWVPTIERIVREMRDFGVDIITANCEYAGSQWEINYAPGSGMAGPDRAFSFKNGVKEIARKEGLLASFMSKPFADSAGCGAHTHMSLVRIDGGKSAMSEDGAEVGLSKVGRQFVAGQLRLCPPRAHAQLSQEAAPPHVQPDQHFVGARGPQRFCAREGRQRRKPPHREPRSVGAVEPVPRRRGAARQRPAGHHGQARARASRASTGGRGRIEA